jgi:hypothetical protein
MAEKVRNSKYICTECDVAFQLLSWPKKNKRIKYCPMCGDYLAVKPYKAQATSTDIWTDEEIELLDKYIAGEMTIYALSMKIGRDIKAIESRRWRRKKELGILGPKRPEWTDEEKEFGEQCLNGEITYDELAEKVGKTYEAVRAYVSRVRVKRRKQKQGVKAK